MEPEPLPPQRIGDVLAEPGALVWVDIEGTPTQEEVGILARQFGFHELALEDCVHAHQRPKVEQYEGWFFLVAYGFSGRDGSSPHEVAAFVARNYLVTVRKDPPYDLRGVLERWRAHPELAAQGGGYLLYVLLDDIVDGYFDVLDAFEDRSEDLEDRVLGGSSAEGQPQVFRLRKELAQFRRRVAPLRDVLDVLQRRTVPVVTEPLEAYYRDVYDHVLRAMDFADTLREVLTSIIEASLAAVSNRLNEVMKQLTAWASIILVPSLIAGIFGMNVLVPWQGRALGFWVTLALMAGSAGVLYLLFRRRGWL